MSVLIKEWGIGAMQRPATSAPSRRMPAGSNFPWSALSFDPGADESVYVDGEMPEADIYTASGDLEVRLPWVSDTASVGSVRWKVEIVGRADGQAWDVAFSDSGTIEDPRTAGDSLHVAVITLAAPSLSPSDRFVMRITREGTNGLDTYNGADADLLGAKLLAA